VSSTGVEVDRERAVSRVLCTPEGPAIISLGRRLPGASCDHDPGTRDEQPLHRDGGDVPLFGLAPGGVCLAGRSPGRRWALTPPFHPYRSLRGGGVLSVALSFGSPRLGVTQHPAL
jgi:hypothetical protein